MTQMVRSLPAQCGRPTFSPWLGKIPWRRKWQPNPVFLSGDFHGQRSLVTTVHGVTESDTTEQLTHTHTHTHKGKTKIKTSLNSNTASLNFPAVELLQAVSPIQNENARKTGPPKRNTSLRSQSIYYFGTGCITVCLESNVCGIGNSLECWVAKEHTICSEVHKNDGLKSKVMLGLRILFTNWALYECNGNVIFKGQISYLSCLIDHYFTSYRRENEHRLSNHCASSSLTICKQTKMDKNLKNLFLIRPNISPMGPIKFPNFSY